MELVLESELGLEKIALFLGRDLLSEALDIAHVRIEARWIQVNDDKTCRLEELRQVVVADLPPGIMDGYAMFTLTSVLTEAFEGTGITFAIPELGLRWLVP
jgi:hypothetical protein